MGLLLRTIVVVFTRNIREVSKRKSLHFDEPQNTALFGNNIYLSPGFTKVSSDNSKASFLQEVCRYLLSDLARFFPVFILHPLMITGVFTRNIYICY